MKLNQTGNSCSFKAASDMLTWKQEVMLLHYTVRKLQAGIL